MMCDALLGLAFYPCAGTCELKVGSSPIPNHAGSFLCIGTLIIHIKTSRSTFFLEINLFLARNVRNCLLCIDFVLSCTSKTIAEYSTKNLTSYELCVQAHYTASCLHMFVTNGSCIYVCVYMTCGSMHLFMAVFSPFLPSSVFASMHVYIHMKEKVCMCTFVYKPVHI